MPKYGTYWLLSYKRNAKMSRDTRGVRRHQVIPGDDVRRRLSEVLKTEKTRSSSPAPEDLRRMHFLFLL